MTIETQSINEAAQRISNEWDCDIVLWNGEINNAGFKKLAKECSYQKNNVLLVLVTYGGDANYAYRIARFLQSSYEKFYLFIPSVCASAGTLIALGAHKLFLSEAAELGPLDVQILKRDEIGERRSGLLMKSALATLTNESTNLFGTILISIKANTSGLARLKFASEVAERIVVGVMSPIYAQISPENLGQDHQDLSIAHEYGVRLANISESTTSHFVRRLVYNYPSHDFIIDKMEAKNIFKSIEDPSEDMYILMKGLGPVAAEPLDQVVVRALPFSQSGGPLDGVEQDVDPADEPTGEARRSDADGGE